MLRRLLVRDELFRLDVERRQYGIFGLGSIDERL
jgi:hypothetical protein